MMKIHKPKTLEMEKMIWGFLSGSSKPIKARILAQRLDVGERTVRHLIRDLIAQGFLIASTMDPPYGYFVPRTERQRRRYRAQLLSRIKKIAWRLSDFDKIAAKKLQTVLFEIEK